MKRCSTCGVEKPTFEFYRDSRRKDGLKGQCKPCHSECNMRTRDPEKARKHRRESMRRRRRAEPEKYRARDREASRKRQCDDKTKARQQLNSAVRSGRLVRPNRCDECSRSGLKIHGHHDDYSAPLDVRWLCTECHGEVHRDD